MGTSHVWQLVEQWRDRQRFPVSQAALARDIGVKRTAVSQWKLGQTHPSPANLRGIQSATGIAYRDLLDALLRDMGYLPPEARGSGGDDRDAAPIEEHRDQERRSRGVVARTARRRTGTTVGERAGAAVDNSSAKGPGVRQ